jgi:hypothetical protein
LPTNSLGTQTLIVFLKTSEEASGPGGDDLSFEYVVPSIEITAVEAIFSDVDFSHKIKVTGNNIDETLEVIIDGFSQTIESLSSSEAIFALSALNGVSTTDVTIYSAEGYPEGAEIAHSIDLAPALLMIEPKIGSSGGSRISILGSGFGTQTVGLNLQNDGEDICGSVDIYAYGKFYCNTKSGSYTNGTITITVNGAIIDGSYVASDVTYE